MNIDENNFSTVVHESSVIIIVDGVLCANAKVMMSVHV